MTQESAPQEGHIDDGVSPDAGPYSADKWALIWNELFTNTDQSGNQYQGVIGERGDGKLEVTNPSGQTITVAPGSAIVYGRVFQSDANVSFSVTPPSSDSRYDTVVVCQNSSSSPATYYGSADFIFPTSLIDYKGVSSVPGECARLIILKGTPAASPTPPLTAWGTFGLYMTELATYNIDSGGTISELTDGRKRAFSHLGQVYTDKYFTNKTATAYQGRVRITPFTLKFAFSTGQTVDISWNGEADTDPLDLGNLNIYIPTFVLTEIQDLDLLADYGAGYTIYVTVESGSPDYMRFRMMRRGYVTAAGTATAVPSSATDVYAQIVFIQLIDTTLVDPT